MISHLKDVFFYIPMLVLSTRITLTILKNICKSFEFSTVIRLYQKFLNKSNITYQVEEIVKLKYKDLSFLMLDSNKAGKISKIIIFINNINKIQNIVAYFCIMLLFKL